MLLRIGLVAATWSALLPGRALGQSVLRGVVIDSAGNPIVNAQVLIEKLGLSATVGPAGDFRFGSIPGGRFTVLTRSVGFAPDQRTLTFNGRDSVPIEIRLRRSAQNLDSVVVVADAPKAMSPQMRAFEDRRKVGLGRFIMRAALQARENATLGDVLRMVAGARLVRRPEGCGGGFALATSRGGDSGWQPWMRCLTGERFAAACYLTVYLDGNRIWTSGSLEPPNIDAFGVNALEALEVYRGPAELPTEFQTTGSGCGAVLLWSRTGESN